MEGWVFFVLLLAGDAVNPAQHKRQRVLELCPLGQRAAQESQAYPVMVGGQPPAGPGLLYTLFLLGIFVVGLLAALMLWDPSFRRQGDGEGEGAEEAMLSSVIAQISAIQHQLTEVQRLTQRELA